MGVVFLDLDHSVGWGAGVHLRPSHLDFGDPRWALGRNHHPSSASCAVWQGIVPQHLVQGVGSKAYAVLWGKSIARS